MLSVQRAHLGQIRLRATRRRPVPASLLALVVLVSAVVSVIQGPSPAASAAECCASSGARAVHAASVLSQHMVYLPAVSKGAAGNVNRTTTGRIPYHEIWRGELLITGDVEIPPGVRLTVEPGTTVRFTAQSDDQHEPDEYDPQDPTTYHTTMISILARGVLEALGTPEQPITFTSDSEQPGEMDWQSIMVEDSGAAFLEYVVVEHGHFGLQLNSVDLHASVTHSTIRNTTTCCICTDRHAITGPIVISDNRFIACGREAIDTYADQAIIVHHNVFADNYVGIMSVGSSIIVENNLFIGNSRGIGVIEDGTPAIISNEFTENKGAAIFVTGAAPLITKNNLHANVWNLQLEGSERGVTAEYNWWGTANPRVIRQTILDGLDDPSLGLVDFEPYSWAPFDLDVPAYEWVATSP